MGVPYPTIAGTIGPSTIRTNTGAVPRVMVTPAMTAILCQFRPVVLFTGTKKTHTLGTPTHFAPPVFLSLATGNNASGE